MKPAYMPFTHISGDTARLLKALVGPVVVYLPWCARIPDALVPLASQGLVETRAPMSGDDARLQTALTEFKDWAQMNPGRSTAGADFVGNRQGEIPFYEETAVNRIRSDLNRYRSSDRAPDDPDAAFGVRLFLAVAQENDQAGDLLDQELHRFSTLEKAFLEDLNDTDEVGFTRRSPGAAIWQEDPGARMTAQRLRAWARLAQSDLPAPDLLVTTSAAVMDTLMEAHGDAIGLQQLAAQRIAVPADDSAPLLGALLADMLAAQRPSAEALAAFESVAAATAQPAAMATLYAAERSSVAGVIDHLAAATAAPTEVDRVDGRQGLILLVRGGG
jgi:hypothetical protein